MENKKLQIDQLERKLKHFAPAAEVVQPSNGWIKAIRTALGMSLLQLADKLSITKQSALALEQREAEGKITLHRLKAVANAMDMELVYGLVPKDGSLDGLIDRKARELATRIVARTANTLKLEDQENTKERLDQAVEDRVERLKNELPKVLWD